MSCCPTACNQPGTYKFKAISYGIPSPVYQRNVTRVNGMFQDQWRGFRFNPCEIPCKDCPPVVTESLPPTAYDAQIPTTVVGNDVYLLGEPAKWEAQTVDGVTYATPLYSVT